jgi:hypothetical protein
MHCFAVLRIFGLEKFQIYLELSSDAVVYCFFWYTLIYSYGNSHK